MFGKPKTGKFSTFTTEQLQRIVVIVGNYICTLPPKSHLVGHKRPMNTIRDYLRSNIDNELTSVAFEFLIDLSKETSESLVRKWYDHYEDDNGNLIAIGEHYDLAKHSSDKRDGK